MPHNPDNDPIVYTKKSPPQAPNSRKTKRPSSASVPPAARPDISSRSNSYPTSTASGSDVEQDRQTVGPSSSKVEGSSKSKPHHPPTNNHNLIHKADWTEHREESPDPLELPVSPEPPDRRRVETQPAPLSPVPSEPDTSLPLPKRLLRSTEQSEQSAPKSTKQKPKPTPAPVTEPSEAADTPVKVEPAREAPAIRSRSTAAAAQLEETLPITRALRSGSVSTPRALDSSEPKQKKSSLRSEEHIQLPGDTPAKVVSPHSVSTPIGTTPARLTRSQNRSAATPRLPLPEDIPSAPVEDQKPPAPAQAASIAEAKSAPNTPVVQASATAPFVKAPKAPKSTAAPRRSLRAQGLEPDLATDQPAPASTLADADLGSSASTTHQDAVPPDKPPASPTRRRTTRASLAAEKQEESDTGVPREVLVKRATRSQKQDLEPERDLGRKLGKVKATPKQAKAKGGKGDSCTRAQLPASGTGEAEALTREQSAEVDAARALAELAQAGPAAAIGDTQLEISDSEDEEPEDPVAEEGQVGDDNETSSDLTPLNSQETRHPSPLEITPVEAERSSARLAEKLASEEEDLIDPALTDLPDDPPSPLLVEEAQAAEQTQEAEQKSEILGVEASDEPVTESPAVTAPPSEEETAPPTWELAEAGLENPPDEPEEPSESPIEAQSEHPIVESVPPVEEQDFRPELRVDPDEKADTERETPVDFAESASSGPEVPLGENLEPDAPLITDEQEGQTEVPDPVSTAESLDQDDSEICIRQESDAPLAETVGSSGEDIGGLERTVDTSRASHFVQAIEDTAVDTSALSDEAIDKFYDSPPPPPVERTNPPADLPRGIAEFLDLPLQPVSASVQPPFAPISPGNANTPGDRVNTPQPLVEEADGAIGLKELEEAQVDDLLEADPPAVSDSVDNPDDPSPSPVNRESSPLTSAPPTQERNLLSPTYLASLAQSPESPPKPEKRLLSYSSSPSSLSSEDSHRLPGTVEGSALHRLLPITRTLAEQRQASPLAKIPLDLAEVEGLATQVPVLAVTPPPSASPLQTAPAIEAATTPVQELRASPTSTPPTSLAEALFRGLERASTSPTASRPLLFPPTGVKVEQPSDKLKPAVSPLHNTARGPSSSLSPVPADRLQRLLQSLSPPSDRARRKRPRSLSIQADEEEAPEADPDNDTAPSPPDSALVTPAFPDEATFAPSLTFPSRTSTADQIRIAEPSPEDLGTSARVDPADADGISLNDPKPSKPTKQHPSRRSARHSGGPLKQHIDFRCEPGRKRRKVGKQEPAVAASAISAEPVGTHSAAHLLFTENTSVEQSLAAGEAEKEGATTQRHEVKKEERNRAAIGIFFKWKLSILDRASPPGDLEAKNRSTAVESAQTSNPAIEQVTEESATSTKLGPTTAVSNAPIAVIDLTEDDNSRAVRELSSSTSPIIKPKRGTMPRKSAARIIASPPASAGPDEAPQLPTHQRQSSDSSLSDAPASSQPTAAVSQTQVETTAAPATFPKIKLKIGGSKNASTASSDTADAIPSVERASSAVPIDDSTNRGSKASSKRKEPVNADEASRAPSRASKKAKGREEPGIAPLADPSGEVDMEPAAVAEGAGTKGKGNGKGKKASATTSGKGGAKKGKGGAVTADAMIHDLLPSSPAEPSTAGAPPPATTASNRSARAKRGKANRDQSAESGPGLSSSPSAVDSGPALETPAAQHAIPLKQPTPVPPPHADPTPPTSKVSSPAPLPTAVSSRQPSLAKAALKKNAAAAKSDEVTKTPIPKKALSGAASASTGKKIGASSSGTAQGTPTTEGKGMARSASALGIGASASSSPAPAAAPRQAPRQSLLAATLAKASAPPPKMETKKSNDKKEPSGQKAAAAIDARIPKHAQGPNAEELREYAQTAAQRAKDRAIRAAWKESAVNLQAAKDCYRADSRPAEDRLYTRVVGRHVGAGKIMLQTLQGLWASDEKASTAPAAASNTAPEPVQ